MFDTVRKTIRLDLGEQDDLDQYDDILNNPLCTVVERKDEKLSTRVFDEGKIASIEDRLITIITWEEKVLL